jgi:hypothetical protein
VPKEKPQKLLSMDKKTPNGRNYAEKNGFSITDKNGFLDVCLGKFTDFVQDWVRGFYCGFFGAHCPSRQCRDFTRLAQAISTYMPRWASLLLGSALSLDAWGSQDAPCFIQTNEARVGLTCLLAQWINVASSFVGTPRWLPLDDSGSTRGCANHSTSMSRVTNRVVDVIAVAQRGGCSFAAKAMAAMRLGAIGLIIVNYDESGIIPMGASASEILRLSHFSAVMVPKDWLSSEITESWSTIGNNTDAPQDSVVGFNPVSLSHNASVQSRSVFAAIAAELSREGRHRDALLQLEAAVKLPPSFILFYCISNIRFIS